MARWLLEGMPQTRIDVAGLLAGNKAAMDALAARYEAQGKLLAEKSAVEAKLRETEARLIDMGQKYEAERNMGIMARVCRCITWTLVVGGLIALCVFCPIAIPILGRILAWTVSMFPKLTGAVGVVGKGAFDAVVTGVEKAKAEMPVNAKAALETELSRAMDAAHKRIVRGRKQVLIS